MVAFPKNQMKILGCTVVYKQFPKPLYCECRICWFAIRNFFLNSSQVQLDIS